MPGTKLRVRTKVWIEREDGAVLISDFRAQLLAAIVEHGSVAAAARAVGLPQRTAWKKLLEMERAAGFPLLESASGGAEGGATRLTEAGTAVLSSFRRLAEPLLQEANVSFDLAAGCAAPDA